MDTNQARNMIKIGHVSSVNGKTCTARVTFPDQDDVVSQELPIVTIGSNGTQGYWVPDVDTQVLCVFLPNPSGKGMNDGFIIGAFYSTANPPAESDPNVRSIRVPDGSYIRFDGKGTVEIHAASHLVLTAPKIDIN